jgi:hypothetical protein
MRGTLFEIMASLLLSSRVVAYSQNVRVDSLHRRRSTALDLQADDMVGVWRLTPQSFSLLGNTEQPLTPLEERPNCDDDIRNDGDFNADASSIFVKLSRNGCFALLPKENTGTREIVPASDSRLSEIATEFGEVLSRGGNWCFECEQQGSGNRAGTLILAVARPGPDVRSMPTRSIPLTKRENKLPDIIFISEVARISSTQQTRPQTAVALACGNGELQIGRFVYPWGHPSFFDNVRYTLLQPRKVGSFHSRQVVKDLASSPAPETVHALRYRPQDFYHRKFYLTMEALAVNPTYAATDKHYDVNTDAHDVRVLTISFHSNNTFTAINVSRRKILRGRFGIRLYDTWDQGRIPMLWFAVSLFGTGRSAPGSVYSEGPDVSHDDQLTYRGEILRYDSTTGQEREPMLNWDNEPLGSCGNATHSQGYNDVFFVHGSSFYGTDFGSDARPEPVGKFSLKELPRDEKKSIGPSTKVSSQSASTRMNPDDSIFQ